MTMKCPCSRICWNNSNIDIGLCWNIYSIFESYISCICTIDTYNLKKISVQMHRMISSGIIFHTYYCELSLIEIDRFIIYSIYLIIYRPTLLSSHHHSRISSHHSDTSKIYSNIRLTITYLLPIWDSLCMSLI